jgi:hypothetical protein
LIICLGLAGTLWWFAEGSHDVVKLLQINATCLGLGALLASRDQMGLRSTAGDRASRRARAAFLATRFAVAMFAVAVGIRVVRDLADLPRTSLTAWDWLAAVTTTTALIVQLPGARTGFASRALYVVGLGVIGMLLVLRDLSPGTYFVWTGICELTGFVLVAALAGWVPSRWPARGRHLRATERHRPGRDTWFCTLQAILAAISLPLIVWIALDSRFDRMGEGHALLGLAGRLASCPAALILLGGTIVMAWQTVGRWRSAWQYSSFAAGVLFTTVIGWSRIDQASHALWSQRFSNLMITAAMMTLLTRFGLSRVLPYSGDWLVRARRAAPAFAGLAVLMFLLALISRWFA